MAAGREGQSADKKCCVHRNAVPDGGGRSLRSSETARSYGACDAEAASRPDIEVSVDIDNVTEATRVDSAPRAEAQPEAG